MTNGGKWTANVRAASVPAWAEEAERRMQEIKRVSQTAKDLMAAGPYRTDTDMRHNLYNITLDTRSTLEQAAQVPEINDRAKDFRGDRTYDAVATYNAVIATLTPVLTECQRLCEDLPKDAGGNFGWLKFDGELWDEVTFSTADTATLRGLLDAVINAVPPHTRSQSR